MNICLIGMAGAGKSYIGRKLASNLDLEFLDNDEALKLSHGKGIQEILDDVGEEKYLETEAQTLIQGTRGKDNLVISPGGSVIYRNDAMDHLKDISTIIYLRVPFETIELRLKDLPPRAIIGLGRKSLRELFDERHPLYITHADKTIDLSESNADHVVETILSYLGVDNAALFR